MHVKEIYVIFIHLFDSEILLIIDLNKKKRQLANLHRNRRYFVINLHKWFCLSYFLKTNITFYCIYQYFMSINSFFNTVSVYPCRTLVNCSSAMVVSIRYSTIKKSDRYWISRNYFMSINSFFNTVSVSRYSRPITVTCDPD
jgi:hypothetical protein